MLNIGKAIQIVRQAKGMRLGDVASAAGVSSPFLSLVESGERQPSLNVIRQLSAALQVPSEALIMIAMNEGHRLRSTDEHANALTESLARVLDAEANLKRALEQFPKNEPKGTNG